MFQFIRRVSASFLPRPDRPWRDDATSHAPTIAIGRKRRFSVTEQDDDDYTPSVAKRAKGDQIEPDAGCDSAPEADSPKGDVPPVDGQDVKEVTKGVKEVDLLDKDKEEDPASTTHPEGVPLPDSPSGSPEPESDSREPTKAVPEEVVKDEEHANDNESVASSSGKGDEDKAEGSGENEAKPITNTTTAVAPADEIAASEGVTVPVESGSHETPDALEIKA